jgi:hypothetical protein
VQAPPSSGNGSAPEAPPPPEPIASSLAPERQFGPEREIRFEPDREALAADESEPVRPVIQGEDIDRVALAREFAELLQDGPFSVEEGR